MIRFRDFIKLDLEQLATLRALPSIDDPQPHETSKSSEFSLDLEIRDEQRSTK